MMRSPQRLLVIGTLGLGLGLFALLLVVRLGSWRTPWPLPLLDTLALYAFLPFLGVAAVALMMRSRALALLSVAALLFFGHQYGSAMVGAMGITSRMTAAAPVTSSQLRVLTLNAQAPSDDPGLLLNVIREHQPDVVALQEVTAAYADVLERAIGADYPFSYTADLETEHEGAGTWSRLPLEDPQAFRLSEWGNQLHRVRVKTPNGAVWLYNVHLPNPSDPDKRDEEVSRLATIRAFDESRRDAELKTLVDQAAGHDVPVILAGDFNVSAGSHAYRHLLTGWRDAFAEAGQGFGHTYPTPDHDHEGDEPHRFKRPFALLRIDYVLTRGDVRPTRAWTETVIESDHEALLTDLELPTTR